MTFYSTAKTYLCTQHTAHRMKKSKYYVVWDGFAPGVYDSWEECQLPVEGYKGAKYKAFDSQEDAIEAFRGRAEEHIGLLRGISDHCKGSNATPKQKIPATASPAIIRDSLAVDAACSGNPGTMEYRGVYVATGQEIFRLKPMQQGTNNIGEFLAIVHGLAYLKQHNSHIPIYSDSRNAILWVKHKQCKTRLQRTAVNAPIFDLIARAEAWLRNNTYSNPIIKWETETWGEIPADFGRK